MGSSNSSSSQSTTQETTDQRVALGESGIAASGSTITSGPINISGLDPATAKAQLESLDRGNALVVDLTGKTLASANNTIAGVVSLADAFTTKAFDAGENAVNAAYGAVSEINSAASDGTSAIPGVSDTLVAGAMGVVALFFLTKH